MNRKDFPILRKIHYLDNAATSQKPKKVIEAIDEFYTEYNSNTHRGIYRISEKATKMLEDSRKTFAEFINAKPEEIIFTKGATESLNSLSRSLATHVGKMDNIVITEIEHHSNLVPWQQLAQSRGAELRIARYNSRKQSLESISKLVDENTKIVSFTMMSNVTGIIIDAKKTISEIKRKSKKATIIIDAAQAAAHTSIDVKKLGCDFLCFSTHKLYGPFGTGILFGRKELLESMEPFQYGGHMISEVSLEESNWAEPPSRFEAGTLDAASIIASAEAIRYIKKIGMKSIKKTEDKLKKSLLISLRKTKGVKIIGHNTQNYGPVVSFTVDKIHPHDLAQICDRHNACIRAGHHCAQPFMKALGVDATARASLSFYNDESDIKALIDSINDARRKLNG